MSKNLISFWLVSVMFFGLATQEANAIEENISARSVFIDWIFEPEVETNAGFNVDAMTYGLLGRANLDLKTDIYTKADKEFKGRGDYYGEVIIKDFVVRVFVDDASDDYNSQNATTSPFQIKWGTFLAKINLGPVYFVLKNSQQDEITFIETIDDSDLDFSNIAYSVIPPFYTASYSGMKGQDVDSTEYLNSDNDATSSDAIDNSFSLRSRNQGELAFGILLPEIIRIEIGGTLAYSYRETVSTIYNPFSIMLSTDFLAVDKLIKNFSIKTKFALSGGQHNEDILDYHNPLSAGLFFGYDLPIENWNLQINLAGEAQLMNTKSVNVNTDAEKISSDDSVMYIPYELALGTIFGWPSLGASKSDNEDSYLAMSNRNFKVQDGFGLSLLYGHMQHRYYRNLNLEYVGAKISLWESEDLQKNMPGVAKGLNVGLIINMNYAFGGEISLENFGPILTSRKIRYQPRLDLGAGLEISQKISFVRPYLGVIYKLFGFLETGGVTFLDKTSGGVFSEREFLEYENQEDLRLKLGADIVDIIPHVIFRTEWQSGDIVNDDQFYGTRNFSPYNYFENNQGDTNNDVSNSNTLAKWGFVSMGVIVKY